MPLQPRDHVNSRCEYKFDGAMQAFLAGTQKSMEKVTINLSCLSEPQLSQFKMRITVVQWLKLHSHCRVLGTADECLGLSAQEAAVTTSALEAGA